MSPTRPISEAFSSSDSSSDEDGNELMEVSAKPNPKIPPLVSTVSTDDSDSDPPPLHRRPSLAADPTIKPIASKPMDETLKSKPKKPAVRSDTPTMSPKSAPKTEKRKRKIPEEDDDITSGGTTSEKKIPQRVWSEEDEIALLEGLLEYRSKYGLYPSTPTDFESFHGFVRKSLQNEYTKTQVSDKVRRLRRKYSNSSGRSKKGDFLSSSQNHEHTLYGLFKKVWGSKKPVVENSNGNKEEVENAKVGILTSSKKSKNDENGNRNKGEVETTRVGTLISPKKSRNNENGNRNKEEVEITKVGTLTSPKKSRNDENGNGNKEEVETAKVGTLTSPKKSRNKVVATRAALAESPAIVGGEYGVGNDEILYPTLNEIVTQLEIEHANSSMRGAFRRALKSLKPSEGQELEKKWDRQCIAEMQLCMSREELKKELIGKFSVVLSNGS